MLSVKCFKHHLNGKVMQQNELWISVMSLPRVKLCMCGPGIERNCQMTAVLKTLLTISQL